MSFWRLYYHFVWATKNRLPLIAQEDEDLLARSMQATCTELGILVHAMGFMPDHVHLALSIPPKHAISNVAQQLKGTTSRRLNEQRGQNIATAFSWQPEYGVLSFGEQSLDRIIAYVNGQRVHHASDDLWPMFEMTERPFEVGHKLTVNSSPGGTSRP